MKAIYIIGILIILTVTSISGCIIEAPAVTQQSTPVPSVPQIGDYPHVTTYTITERATTSNDLLHTMEPCTIE